MTAPATSAASTVPWTIRPTGPVRGLVRSTVGGLPAAPALVAGRFEPRPRRGPGTVAVSAPCPVSGASAGIGGSRLVEVASGSASSVSVAVGGASTSVARAVAVPPAA